MPRDDDSRSNRQIARGKMRREGDRTARLARTLMELRPPVLKRLELEEGLREAIDRARRITTLIARRRAERTLAGDLRRFDTADLDAQLAKVHDGNVDEQQFHLAEKWRTKLLAEGLAGAETFPGGADAELPRLIDAAQRERDTGKPPGAARALFRHVAEALKVARRAAELAAAETDDAAPDAAAEASDEADEADD
ncbi:MAG: ribosome biogenesis factor YjgA [Kofleriaceae bacterium]